jgi:hypothetical protein
MKKILLSLLLGISLATAQAQTADKILVENTKLSDKEYDFFSKLRGKNHFVPTSKNAKRYYKLDSKKKKVYIKTELVFSHEDLHSIAHDYIYSNVSFTGDLSDLCLQYAYSEGKARTVTGSVITMGEHIIQTEFSCGTSACTQTLVKNHKVVYSKTE